MARALSGGALSSRGGRPALPPLVAPRRQREYLERLIPKMHRGMISQTINAYFIGEGGRVVWPSWAAAGGRVMGRRGRANTQHLGDHLCIQPNNKKPSCALSPSDSPALSSKQRAADANCTLVDPAHNRSETRPIVGAHSRQTMLPTNIWAGFVDAGCCSLQAGRGNKVNMAIQHNSIYILHAWPSKPYLYPPDQFIPNCYRMLY